MADGFDAEHRCHALAPPAPLERARQVQLCLTEAHVRCERFAAARTAWLAASSGLPRVAPDVAFGRTRLILEPEPAWRNLAGPPTARISRRAILIAAAGGAVLVLLVVGNLFGLLGRAPAPTASPTPSPSVSASVGATPTPTPSSRSPEASPSIAPTTTPTQATTPTPAPTPLRYVVQANDTLTLIAQRFGTTAQAIAEANQIAVSDTLNIGQILIIP